MSDNDAVQKVGVALKRFQRRCPDFQVSNFILKLMDIELLDTLQVCSVCVCVCCLMGSALGKGMY